jgi:hypothetical protein
MYADNPTRFRTAYAAHLDPFRGPARRPKPSTAGGNRR